jgi:hypothetical protein
MDARLSSSPLLASFLTHTDRRIGRTRSRPTAHEMSGVLCYVSPSKMTSLSQAARLWVGPIERCGQRWIAPLSLWA